MNWLVEWLDALPTRFWYPLLDRWARRHPESREISATRYWKLSALTPRGYYLQSCVWDMDWDGPVVHADQRPARTSLHGIHALKDPWNGEWEEWGGYVKGTVQLWGTVVEGTKGYRAEHAMVRELWLPWHFQIDQAAAIAESLAARYQCPVHWRKETWG